MSKLIKYAETSPIMDIKIKYNDQIFSFNLDAEVKVSENNIALHLKNQTRGYAFLAMLHKKLIIKVRDEQKAYNRIKGEELAKLTSGEGGAKWKAEAALASIPKLVKMERAILELEESRDILEVTVRAFEMRKDLIQTLSANIRKERI